MSAFEVTITPTRLRNAKRQEARSPTAVCMAPFSSKSVVEFLDVPLSKTAKRMLRIMNPTNEDIEVEVTRPVPLEYNLSIEWTQKLVPAMSEVQMELIWVPQMDVASKEKMQITDSRNFRKDVEILFKSKNNQVKATRKFPTLSSASSSSTSSSTSYVKTLRLKSPRNNMKTVKRTNTTQMQTQQRQKMSVQTKPQSLPPAAVVGKSTTDKGGKVTCVQQQRQPLSNSNVLTANTFATLRNCNVSPIAGNNDENVPKENISPLTTSNMLDLIDNLNFTPANTVTKSQARQTCSNLTYLPTPVNTAGTTFIKDANASACVQQSCELKPRKLNVSELEGLSPTTMQTNPQIQISFTEVTNQTTVITNKTFNVNPTEELNITQDLLDSSSNGGVPMNQTTTIQSTPMGRTLTIIKEEEDHSAVITTTQQQPTVPTLSPTSIENLKRDIKLIGTPLRKYSESMKDLSLKSPQNKLAIQGSMPNLNEMESIRCFEQNRYLHQSGSQQSLNNKKRMSTVLEQNSSGEMSSLLAEEMVAERKTLMSSHVELNFDQLEITAQSSRFNLNEVGLSKAINRNSLSNIYFNQQKKFSNANLRPKLSPKGANAIQKNSPTQKYEQTPRTSMIGQKRTLHDLSLSDTRSTDSLASTDSQKQKMHHKVPPIISPPKRQRIDLNKSESSFLRPTPVNASRKDWSRIQPKKVPRLSKTLSFTKRPITPRKDKVEERIKLYDPDMFLQTCINPDPFAATTTCDPFLASTMYLDQQAVDRHQTDFRKWLNALVTIPADLDADSNTKIDVGRLFNEVRNKDLTLAPTKEEQSMNYLTKFRLDSLRRAAVELFLSEEIRLPCSKVAVYVTKQVIGIRQDRNLHLDVVMQRNILELLLCFNPLWLRLGLEVVFGEQIHLQSNRDVVGLSSFILNRLFRDKFLEQKYSKAYTLSDEYAEYIKKFTLQKMLFLLLFLDKAKTKRIIKHNPCLFVKKSPYKETKEILLKLSSELLAKIGDITRELKRFGYVLQHKQTFLDEFDYAFNNLAVDLRDGVRLTRVIEIILLRDDLTQQLRVPAISRLQRIFNVNLGLRALNEADFQLCGDITAADIVDGHREKTLSVLWQIIYKFRSPRFHAAARTIQAWWRKNWLRIIIRRRIQQKEMLRRELAATKIQACFRGCMTRRYVQVYKAERVNAATVLQKYTRRFLVQKQLTVANNAALIIQRHYRAHLLKRQCRQQYLRLRECTIFLQRVYRRRLLRRQLLRLAEEARLQRAQKRHAAAVHIQCYWRACKEMSFIRTQYLLLRQSIIVVQQKFRARLQMHQDRAKFLELRRTAIFVQQKFRAMRLMRIQRQCYLETRNILMKLQRRRRAQLQMRVQLQAYMQTRALIINLQRRVRATLAMKTERTNYLRLRDAACILQQRYRAQLAMRQQQADYQHIRDSIILIQRKWRATLLARHVRVQFIDLQYHAILLQQRFRANKRMQRQRSNYLHLRDAAIVLQRRYRAKCEMIKARLEFQHKKKCVITLQRRFRAYKAMRFQRAKYQGTRNAVICLQQHIRAFLLMKQVSGLYQNLKSAVIFVQCIWRAKLQMQKDRTNFQRLRAATISIQRRYRDKLEMRKQIFVYQKKRQLIIALQRRFRAKLLGREVRKEYFETRAVIIKIQRHFRANQTMRAMRQIYQDQRNRIITIQRYFRSYLLTKSEQLKYQEKRRSAIRIQRWYRATMQMRQLHAKYQNLRTKTLIIQKKWRATLAARQQRFNYVETLKKIICLQRRFRATLKMKAERSMYLEKRQAAIVLQQRYRAHLEMLKIRSQYQLIITLTICIQRKFRARLAMRHQRAEYLLLRRTTIHLQQKFRGKRLMEEKRSLFLTLRRTVPELQARARGFLARRRFQELLTPEMLELMRRKRAARIIQRNYRGYRVRKRLQNACLTLIRRNIIAAKAKATITNSLRVKLQESVQVLRGRYSISEILSVLQRLERLSRVVPHLLITQSEFISSFCYGIMAQAIRSEIDKQMIELCSRIILNLARYDSVNANTFQQNGLVTIAQMLLRWCDKDCEIFNTLCTLVWLFAHCEEKRKIIREFMVTPDAIYMLRETKKLVARKEKMKLKDRRHNAITPYSMRCPQKRQFSSRALPSLEPDYGIIQNKPYTFISSVYAFDSLLCILDVNVY